MLLDLFSTVTGALIATFSIVTLGSIWISISKPEDACPCPFLLDGACNTECEGRHRCHTEKWMGMKGE